MILVVPFGFRFMPFLLSFCESYVSRIFLYSESDGSYQMDSAVYVLVSFLGVK